jgi:hypothetical protein
MGVKPWKVLEMLRQDQIRHIHTNRTHAGARIPREEFMRMVKGDARSSGQGWGDSL